MSELAWGECTTKTFADRRPHPQSTEPEPIPSQSPYSASAVWGELESMSGAGFGDFYCPRAQIDASGTKSVKLLYHYQNILETRTLPLIRQKSAGWSHVEDSGKLKERPGTPRRSWVLGLREDSGRAREGLLSPLHCGISYTKSR